MRRGSVTKFFQQHGYGFVHDSEVEQDIIIRERNRCVFEDGELRSPTPNEKKKLEKKEFPRTGRQVIFVLGGTDDRPIALKWATA
jgi:hypothetical protein